MKNFSIYNTKYNLFETTSTPPDAFGYHNELLDEPPAKGKKVGYVKMEDGSIIECYGGFNPAIIIVPAVVILVILTGVFLYFRVLKPNKLDIDVSLPINKEVDNTDIVVSYNGFMAIKDGQLSVNFQNGSDNTTIQIIADGINCEPYTAEPNEFVNSLPVTYSTEEGLVSGVISIKTPSSETEQDIVIEIPENNTSSSPEGLDGYWKGEYVYGTGDEGSESE